MHIDPWEALGSRPRGDYKVFSVREEHRRSPLSGREGRFFVIDSNDWVNVIPVTPEGALVFVAQYRHGTEEVTLEVPGGLVDPEDEDPAAAARREMQEETGYDTDDLVYLGVVAPNPAIQSNRCFTYLARGARQVGVPQPDGTEELAVHLVRPEAVPGLIVGGQITHALVVAAFYLYEQWLRGLVPAAPR